MHPGVYRPRLTGVRWSCCRGLACEQGFPLGRTHGPSPALLRSQACPVPAGPRLPCVHLPTTQPLNPSVHTPGSHKEATGQGCTAAPSTWWEMSPGWGTPRPCC